MDFDLLSDITEVRVIAAGREIRELNRLRRSYGKGRWRKMKGRATVRIKSSGEIRTEEIHWYEAHGVGKREFKIKARGG